MRHPIVQISTCLLGVIGLVGCAGPQEAAQPPTELVTENAAVYTASGYRVEPVVVDLCEPVSITLDGEGHLYIAEQGVVPEAAPPRILRVSPAGHIDVLTDRLNGPVHAIRWQNGRLMVWDERETAWLSATGERRGVAGPPQPAPGRVLIDRSGGFGASGDRFVIAGGRVVRQGAAGTEVFLDSAHASGSRRLVDLAFALGDKALYVADLGPLSATSASGPPIGGNGVIWRITPMVSDHLGPPPGLAPPQQFGVSRQATRPSH